MKLKNLPNKEALDTFTLRLRKSEAKLLNDYLEWARAATGVDLSMPELLASMVTSFIESDSEFKNRNKKKRATPPAAAPVTKPSTF